MHQAQPTSAKKSVNADRWERAPCVPGVQEQRVEQDMTTWGIIVSSCWNHQRRAFIAHGPGALEQERAVRVAWGLDPHSLPTIRPLPEPASSEEGAGRARCRPRRVRCSRQHADNAPVPRPKDAVTIGSTPRPQIFPRASLTSARPVLAAEPCA